MKIASLLFIPALLLSGLTARAGLPASFKERLAEASRENRTIQCDFTQHKQVRRMKNEIELKGRFYYDNSLAMALDYTVPEGDKVIIRNDRIILKTAGQVTQTATSANPMLQQVALMIRASMTGDLSQFGQGWQIGYTEKEGVGDYVPRQHGSWPFFIKGSQHNQHSPLQWRRSAALSHFQSSSGQMSFLRR